MVDECDHVVRLQSPTLGAQATVDPRGEVAIEVYRLGHEDPFDRWTWSGMVGRASLTRVLEIAMERLQADEAVLRGDSTYFDQLAMENKRISEEWTAYYAGKGPRPQTGKLP